MFVKLISLGLLIIPFFIWPGFDTRQPKLFMALVFSLALGLFVFWKGYFKPYKNIWLLLFLAFIPLNFLLAPHVEMPLAGVQIPSYILEAFLFVLVFFLAHAAVSSYQFTNEDKWRILRVTIWVGLIMSLYAIVQRFGFDQFFTGQNPRTLKNNVCGTLGQPDILAPFLAMIIPIMLYFRKYTWAITTIIAIFLTDSQIGYGAMIVSLMFLLGTKSKKLAIAMALSFFLLSSILVGGYFRSNKIKAFIDDGGRFHVWSQIPRDVKGPITVDKGMTRQYSLTGFGLGSFRYLYHSQHPEGQFLEAHNEYLELLYNTGLIGLGLFLMGIGFFIKQSFSSDRLTMHLFASFLCIAICAGGIFCWHNGAIIFYTIVLTGLLNQKREAVE